MCVWLCVSRINISHVPPPPWSYHGPAFRPITTAIIIHPFILFRVPFTFHISLLILQLLLLVLGAILLTFLLIFDCTNPTIFAVLFFSLCLEIKFTQIFFMLRKICWLLRFNLCLANKSVGSKYFLQLVSCSMLQKISIARDMKGILDFIPVRSPPPSPEVLVRVNVFFLGVVRRHDIIYMLMPPATFKIQMNIQPDRRTDLLCIVYE